MAKQTVDALINGGKASAAPPLGPALGPLGVNIGQVIAEINSKTAAFDGMQVPVSVEVDTDTKEFTISIGTPPASALIKQEAGIKKALALANEGDIVIITGKGAEQNMVVENGKKVSWDDRKAVRKILGIK